MGFWRLKDWIIYFKEEGGRGGLIWKGFIGVVGFWDWL